MVNLHAGRRRRAGALRAWSKLALLAPAVLAILTTGAPEVAQAHTSTIGETVLSANGGSYLQVGTPGKGVPVFQGAASGNYVLTSASSGTLTSWSFRSGGAPQGSRFELAVLGPAGGADDGVNYRLFALSAPQSVKSATGVDGLEGPFALKPTIAIDTGARIALVPLDGTNVPLEQGAKGTDGIRTFDQPFSGGLGSSQAISPGSANNNSYVLPVQATVDDGQAAPSLENTGLPSVKSSTSPPKPGATLTCSDGSWSWSGTGGISYSYQWLWDGQLPAAAPPIHAAGTVFGSGSTGGLNRFLGEPKEAIGRDSLLGTTRSITVPPLDSPARFYCTVTASAGGQRVDASSVKLLVPPNPPQLRAAGPSFPKKLPPSIPTTLGVGAVTTCQPGVWTGTPQFTYEWYALSGINARQLRAKGQRYMPTADDEGLQLQCTVTARNLAGSASAESNHGSVSVAAAVAKDTPPVHYDARSPNATGLITGPGSGVIAEQVVLDCRSANWNRTDLKSSYQWFVVDYLGDVLSAAVPGGQLTFDMTPSNLQYDVLVACRQTVTTSRGVTSQVMSAPVHVWNGCNEIYTVSGDKGSPDQFVRPGVHHLLDTTSPLDGSLTSLLKKGLPLLRGLFGLFGQGLPADEPPNVSPWRAVTDGPNCLDYQKYLEDKGYDIKQWPTDPSDWITRG